MAGVIFGSFGVLIRILNQDLTTYQQIGFRSVIGFLIALLIMKIRKVDSKSLKGIQDVGWGWFVLFAFTMPVSIIFFVKVMIETKIVLAIFSFYIGSIISSLVIGMIIFKEKVTPKKFISLGLVIAGLWLFSSSISLKMVDRGIFFALLSGFLDVISNSFRKHLAGKINRIILTGLPLLGGIILMLILTLSSQQTLTPSISVITWVVGLIFGGLLFTVNYLLNYGFNHFDLNLGTIVISSELFFASMFGFLFYGELPLLNEIHGGLLVLCAVVVANLDFEKLKILQKLRQITRKEYV